MPRVLVAGKLHPSGFDLLRAAPDVELEYTEAVSTESMLPALYSVATLDNTYLTPHFAAMTSLSGMASGS